MEQYFVENITQIMQHVLQMQQISLLPKYIKWIFRSVILHAFTHVNAHLQKFNTRMTQAMSHGTTLTEYIQFQCCLNMMTQHFFRFSCRRRVWSEDYCWPVRKVCIRALLTISKRCKADTKKFVKYKQSVSFFSTTCETLSYCKNYSVSYTQNAYRNINGFWYMVQTALHTSYNT